MYDSKARSHILLVPQGPLKPQCRFTLISRPRRTRRSFQSSGGFRPTKRSAARPTKSCFRRSSRRFGRKSSPGEPKATPARPPPQSPCSAGGSRPSICSKTPTARSRRSATTSPSAKRSRRVIWLYDVRARARQVRPAALRRLRRRVVRHVRRGLAALRAEDGDRRRQDQGALAAHRVELLPQALRAGLDARRATSSSSRRTSSCSTACAPTSTACASSSTTRSCPTTATTGRNWRDDFQLTLHIQDDVRVVRDTGNIFLTNIHRVFLGDVARPVARGRRPARLLPRSVRPEARRQDHRQQDRPGRDRPRDRRAGGLQRRGAPHPRPDDGLVQVHPGHPPPDAAEGPPPGAAGGRDRHAAPRQRRDLRADRVATTRWSRPSTRTSSSIRSCPTPPAAPSCTSARARSSPRSTPTTCSSASRSGARATPSTRSSARRPSCS